jgi:integrase
MHGGLCGLATLRRRSRSSRTLTGMRSPQFANSAGCGLGRCAVTEESPPSPRYGFHSLRHAAASLFIRYLGWQPKRVQTVLGHSSITMMFDLYGHQDKDADRAAMGKIEAAIVAA